jgi:hypothetical protein
MAEPIAQSGIGRCRGKSCHDYCHHQQIQHLTLVAFVALVRASVLLKKRFEMDFCIRT